VLWQTPFRTPAGQRIPSKGEGVLQLARSASRSKPHAGGRFVCEHESSPTPLMDLSLHEAVLLVVFLSVPASLPCTHDQQAAPYQCQWSRCLPRHRQPRLQPRGQLVVHLRRQACRGPAPYQWSPCLPRHRQLRRIPRGQLVAKQCPCLLRVRVCTYRRHPPRVPCPLWWGSSFSSLGVQRLACTGLAPPLGPSCTTGPRRHQCGASLPPEVLVASTSQPCPTCRQPVWRQGLPVAQHTRCPCKQTPDPLPRQLEPQHLLRLAG
jgi:hypothetical protein